MTYNLLADSLVESNPHLYSYCNRAVLDYRFRGQLLLREILGMSLIPDGLSSLLMEAR